jgi:hypothetical protein
MDCLAITGFSCLGIFIGLIVGWFVNSEKEPGPRSYGAIILAVGGAATSFIPVFAPTTGREIWFYPIALLGGLLTAPYLDVAYNWFYGVEWVRNVNKRAK